jgi:hypothetical protein
MKLNNRGTATLVVFIAVVLLLNVAVLLHKSRGPIFTGQATIGLMESGGSVEVSDNQDSDWETKSTGKIMSYSANIQGLKWINVENSLDRKIKVKVHSSENYAIHLPVDTAVISPGKAKLFSFNTKNAHEKGNAEVRAVII